VAFLLGDFWWAKGSLGEGLLSGEMTVLLIGLGMYRQ
jgi:hypothetical protein